MKEYLKSIKASFVIFIVGTAVSPLLAAGYAGATYFYGRNREN